MSFVDIGWRDGDFILNTSGHPELVYGMDVIRQDILARLHCPPPAHWAYPLLGVDLVRYVQGDTNDLNLLSLRQDVEIGVEQDNRVLRAEAVLTTPNLRAARIQVTAELLDRTVLQLAIPLTGGAYG